MGLAYIEGAGGGGVRSSDVTASAADILTGKYDLTAQSDDEVVQGTMPNNGTVNHSLPINGSFTIAKGYHSGSGKVTQSITTKAAATYYATTSDQTISSGQYLSGAQTIKKLTQTNLTGANIKPGVTISVNNGNANVWSVAGTMASKAAATYYPTTSDQTISSGQYLSGNQVIKAVSQQNLVAGNIKKGVTVYVKNGSGNIFAVTGTFEGYVPVATDLYLRGNAQNLQKYNNWGGDYVVFDTGQITLLPGTEEVGFVTINPVNMAGYTKIIIEGNWQGYVGNTSSDYAQHPIFYAELVNSKTDSYLNRYLMLAEQDFGSRRDTVTWTSYTFSFSSQAVTKYIRIRLQQSATYGFYKGYITRVRLA